MTSSLRCLVVTWDGAGNLLPILALTEELVGRGHAVHVLAHDVQRSQIEAAGVRFIGFATAPQFDQARGEFSGADFMAKFFAFDKAALDDVMGVARHVVLVDCMMPSALTGVKQAGYRTVAIVHALYSFFMQVGDGVFQGPIDGADLALAMSYEAFDRDVEFPVNMVFVGPGRPAPKAPAWPRRIPGKPFVVASLSTGLQGQPGMQRQMLQTLCDALAGLDVEALVTTGRGHTPDSLVAGDNTTLAQRVAHDLLLGEADLLITHAGHGTAMAGIRFGVPMLCLAPGADQPFNAARVAELGLGLSLDPLSSAEEIRAAVVRMLGDATFKARSRQFAARVAQQPGLEAASAAVEALAESRAG
jgi:UDP:flavonoid glycosyltransferase YjiC (YdhE family)